MKHSINVVAHTVETTNEPLNKIGENLTIFSGKAAGVCYMPDDYIEDGIQNTEKALKRAENTAKSGHHSVYGHGHISLVVKTSKMICMILNSLGVYTTSEKSARYTKMQPETELEIQMYTKWRKKLQAIILEIYPKIDDIELSKRLCKKLGIEYNANTVMNGSFSHIKEDDYMEDALSEIKKSETLPSYKLAQENARYMISVFTPTTMMYTISYRQLCLIHDYFTKLQENLENCRPTNFNTRLLKEVKDFREELNKLVKELGKPVTDNKNQHIRFLESQVSGEYSIHNGELVFNKFDNEQYIYRKTCLANEKDEIADTYKLIYFGSLAMLAQAQRHRTLRYKMNLEDAGEFGFYVPEIIYEYEKKIEAPNSVSKEWSNDINSLKDIIPQGTAVRITEQGLFEDYALKCKERLCGRAQLEIMLHTYSNLEPFMVKRDKLSYDNQRLLDSMTNGPYDVVPRCMFTDFKCQEGCTWGFKEAFNRKI